jgi:hypothetical protein
MQSIFHAFELAYIPAHHAERPDLPAVRFFMLAMITYPFAILVAGRWKQGAGTDTAVGALFAVFWLCSGYNSEFGAYTWAWYIALSFGLSLFIKRRVVVRYRRNDLIWYGAWTAFLLVGAIVSEVDAWADRGGWWAVVLIKAEATSLGDAFAIVKLLAFLLALIVVRDYRRGYYRRSLT